MAASEIRGVVAPRRSLVIPMYNEAQRIGATLRVLAASELAGDGYEVLLIDDGSVDETPDIAEKVAADLGMRNVVVVRAAMNRGKGAAVRTGMLAASGYVRVFADADLSAGVDDIVACFERVEAPSVDVVYASRAHPESTIRAIQPGHRVMSGRAFNVILRALGLTDDVDTQCGLKGFTAEAAQTLFAAVTIEGFAFDVEVLALARREGMTVTDMPIAWSHVEASRVRPVRDGASMLRDVIALRRALRRAGPAQPTAHDPGRMSIEKFDIMARLEVDHWWFRAKRELVRAELADRGVSDGVGLDVGCGTGATLSVLDRHVTRVVGAELDAHAAVIARDTAPAGVAVVNATAEDLPLADSTVDCLTSLDVIEHLDDDVRALREYARVGAPGGLVLVTVPAYQWAWSRHDEILGHRRRYTRDQLRAAAEDAGLEVLRVTHFHSWLTPPAVVIRKTPFGRLVGEDEEEVSYVRPGVNRLLWWVASVERRWLRGRDLAFGLSILLVARVTDGPPADG
jgi:dolichyl-phosphate beta-glucosyltransferase